MSFDPGEWRTRRNPAGECERKGGRIFMRALARGLRRLAFASLLPGITAILPGARASDTGAFPETGATAPSIRVVNCDEKVRSRKRGICMNEMSRADFAALAPGVSWYYNWDFETKYQGLSGSMQFIPMVWGNSPEALRGLARYLESAQTKPPAILAINEPNLKGQAFISPSETADLYRRIQDVADRFHVPVVGPNMALGSEGGSSITAEDPVENKMMTYTFMVPFLKATLYYLAGTKTDAPALAFHSYGNAGELKWAVEMMHKTFNRPIWVTEYAQWASPDSAAARKYMIEATDFLERTPYVAGYAWFKERVRDHPTISLLEPESGTLSPLGQVYVTLPAHDGNVYYRIPGRLQAADYVTADRAELQPATDSDGGYQMAADSPAATLIYHLQADSPGMYTLAFRTAGSAGTFLISEGNQVIKGVEAPAGNDWHTVQLSTSFSAGGHELAIHCTAGLRLRWIEFTRR